MNILSEYLSKIQEQSMGVPPVKPVKKPQPNRATTANQSKPIVPKPKKPPVPPQVTQQNQNQVHPKQYFDYMLWTSKILKQGEVFRKNAYKNNCDQFEIGTGERRICKDRCDIETCKKVIQLLRASMGKCSQSNNPEKCKQRYATLIPLYQNKLNKISQKFIKAKKIKKKVDVHVG